MSRYYKSYWSPYVPVAERRRRAAQKAAKMKKAGQHASPVEIAGRKIATTFWGAAWCENLEAYSDYSNRLPRGRTYVRNGSVIDLQIEAGRVRALVSGSDLYTVAIEIEPLPNEQWTRIKRQCAGQIGSLVELLQGSISKSVMEIVTRKDAGLFPSPREIALRCSCPDWAVMCKHVAATLYGVGARLDHEPELLFPLRGVDPTELLAAAIDRSTGAARPRKGRVLETGELSSVFGVDIDMDGISSDEAAAPAKPAKRARRAAKAQKPAAAKTGSDERTAKKATPKKAPVKQDGAAKTTAARRKSAAKEATPKRATAKKTTTKNTAKKKPAPKEATAKTTAKKPAGEKAAANTSAAKKAIPISTPRAPRPRRDH